MNDSKPGPLANINVLDFTWVLTGPYAMKMFADMGANVVKVEQFRTGTNERWQSYRVEKNGVIQSSYHIQLNRGKKSLCINLKHPRGIEIIHELIRKSDIVIENFAPGVMDRLKLDYESIRKVKPDIIYCSISCFGHWGPNSRKPGYDVISQAASGWTGNTAGHVLPPVAIGDTVASMHACTAMLAALHHKTITGEGQNIDISMVDCLFSVHENSLPWYWASEAVGEPVIMEPVGQKSTANAPYGIYKAKNGSIAIALLSQNRWAELIDLMGEGYEWLKDDPRTKDLANRMTAQYAPLVHEALEAWVMSQDSVEEAERKLEEIAFPCCRVKSIAELATTDAHIGAREMRVKHFQPFLGNVHMFGNPLKFSKTPATIRGYAPFVGEHNEEILTSKLGFSENEIAGLYREDVLYHAPEVERLPEELKKNE